jgi:hypothetical protein
VNGSLTIGSTPYSWQTLNYTAEINTGITTNSITWTTKNLYGKDVRLNLFSSPASEILVEKNVGRIGGYDATSEVYSPIVWFRTPATTAEYRVTALLSSYTTEETKNAQEITVTGIGHAMKVTSSQNTDVIYAGKGQSKFDQFSTDADVAFIRQRGENTEVTLLDGSYLKYQDTPWISMSKNADYVTVKKDGGIVDYRIQADPDLRGELFNGPIDPVKIQNPTAAIEQKNIAITGSYAGMNTGNTFDLMSLVKTIGKKVISFFNIRI